jgi:Putative phage tail protein
VPAIIPVIVGLATAGTVYYAAAVLISSLIVGLYTARQARREGEERAASQRAAYLATIKDISSNIRSSNEVGSILYGAAGKVGGPISCWFTNGNLLQYHHYTILHAPHVLHGNTGYMINEDRAVLDGNGWVIGHLNAANQLDESKYIKKTLITETLSLTLNVGGTFTMPVLFDTINSVWTGDNEVKVVSIIGQTVQVNFSNPTAQNCQVSYSRIFRRNLIRLRFYNGEQNFLDADLLIASANAFTLDDCGKGLAYTYVQIEADNDVFGQIGLPNIACLPLGARVYDPRTGLTGYSDNNALCARHYATSPIGLALPASEVNDADIIEAANACDELLLIDGASNYQKRYTCNGILGMENAKRNNFDLIVDSMLGGWVYSQGKMRIRAGAYRFPTLSINEDDVIEVKGVRGYTPRREIYNAVTGTFVDPARGYSAVPFSPLTYPTYEAQDGGQRIYRPQPMALPLCNNNLQSQRIAKAELERTRQGAAADLTCKLTVYDGLPGDTCRVTINRYGWNSKVFEILGRKQNADNVTYNLRETAASVWNWNFGQAQIYDIAPNTNLPNPFSVPAITSLAAASGTVHLLLLAGSVQSRMYLTWDAVTNGYVVDGGKIEIQYRKLSQTQWLNAASAEGIATSQYIDQVDDGEVYIIQARCRNSAGQRGQWTSITHKVIGKTEPPPNVTGLALVMTNGGVQINCNANNEADADYTYFKQGTSWSESVDLGLNGAPIKRAATSYLWGWRPAGIQTVVAKYFDTSGNQSINAATAGITVLSPLKPTINITVKQDFVELRWQDCTTSQPIEWYEIKRGQVEASALVLGTVTARFKMLFVESSGTYRYWVRSRDVAGNYSAWDYADVTLVNPPGYNIINARELTWDGTAVNALKKTLSTGTSLDMLVNTAQTVAQRFASYTSVAAKVVAGDEYVFEPGVTTASYEETIDYLAVVPASTASLALQSDLIGSPTVVVTMSTKTLLGDPWVDFVGQTTCTMIGKRYLKVRIQATGVGGDDLITLRNSSVTLVTKVESITRTLSVTDTTTSNGQRFLFANIMAPGWFDVANVGGYELTTENSLTKQYFYVKDAEPNPLGIGIGIVDQNGVRTTGNVTLTVTGIRLI